MKRYSVSRLRTSAGSKTGLAFHYIGRTDNPADVISEYENSKMEVITYRNGGSPDIFYGGLQIKDSKSNEIIYSDQRISSRAEIPT